MKWICIPKGAWTQRHEKAARKAGFVWDGADMSFVGDIRPETPWGCIVRKYNAPSPKDTVSVAIGIIVGTHDEFGKRLKEGRE